MKYYKAIFASALFFALTFSAFAAGKTEKSELQAGNLKVVFYKQSGSFCLYRLSEVGKDNWVPLYDDRALASTNGYSILVGNKVYSAKRKLGKKLTVENTGSQIVVNYQLTKDMMLKQRFYFSTEKYGTSGRVLCIETSFENTVGYPIDVALKAVFDTNLGEKKRVSLYTDAQSIMSETHIDVAASRANYIVSANSISACVFFIRSENQQVAVPKEIFVANWDYLQSMKWIPASIEGRAFSTRYYNNDSALLFVWDLKRIGLNETYTITNCIGYYDFLKRDIPQEAVEHHLQALPEKQRKNYDDIQKLLEQIETVKNNSDKYSDDQIIRLSEQVDAALLEIQE